MLENLKTAYLRQLAKSLSIENFSNLKREELISQIKEKQEILFEHIFIDEMKCNSSCYTCPMRGFCVQLLDEAFVAKHRDPWGEVLGEYMSHYYEGEKPSDDENFKELQKKLFDLTKNNLK